MTPIKFAMLRDYPFPSADRNVWGLTYEAGEKCRLELDDLGWLHIEQSGEHCSVSPDLVRGLKHVELLTALKPAPPAAVVEPVTRPDASVLKQVDEARRAVFSPEAVSRLNQDPAWKHPKAKR